MIAADCRLRETVFNLYAGGDPELVDAAVLADYIREEAPSLEFRVHGPFLGHWLEAADRELDRERLAVRLARARVTDPERRAGERNPAPGELDYERRFLTAGPDKPSGLLYDGRRLADACAGLLPADAVGPGQCHVALTQQLIGTWDSANARYHVRVAVYGVPSLVSVPGLVQGPARPRGYYIGRRLGMDPARSEQATEGDFLRADDPRLQEALKGYLLQALFYHVDGEPFCEDEDCRLFNAHWQEQVLHAQVRPGAGLCSRHRRMLEEWQ